MGIAMTLQILLSATMIEGIVVYQIKLQTIAQNAFAMMNDIDHTNLSFLIKKIFLKSFINV